MCSREQYGQRYVSDAGAIRCEQFLQLDSTTPGAQNSREPVIHASRLRHTDGALILVSPPLRFPRLVLQGARLPVAEQLHWLGLLRIEHPRGLPAERSGLTECGQGGRGAPQTHAQLAACRGLDAHGTQGWRKVGWAPKEQYERQEEQILELEGGTRRNDRCERMDDLLNQGGTGKRERK